MAVQKDMAESFRLEWRRKEEKKWLQHMLANITNKRMTQNKY